MKLLCLTCLLLAACSPGGDGPEADDAGSGACEDPGAALPDGWQPVARVSGGAVTSQPGAGGVTSSIDASVGGLGNSGGEPFVYLKFGNGMLDKVAIDDAQSFDSAEWDMAFKRYVIRVNGGDSGPGGASVAAVDASTLAGVTAPAAASFAADDWTGDSCVALVDGLGAPATAVGTWYVADDMRLDPLAKVYVLRRADGTSFKLRVLSYYGDPGDPGKSAVFSVEWAAL